MKCEPPLEITEENRRKIISININPSRWMAQEDGSVLDHSEYDRDEQKMLEFSA